MVKNAVPTRYTVSPKPACDSLTRISESRFSLVGSPPEGVFSDSLACSCASGNSSRYLSFGMVHRSESNSKNRVKLWCLEIRSLWSICIITFHHTCVKLSRLGLFNPLWLVYLVGSHLGCSLRVV